ncbi:IS701 family transposase [Dactylosporangium sp. CA-233914]|uniref:IS701 family transposase n=1 Tax=Dactylosporangium sp. CA-233914 TaxID=3239934 RepID=UPI003D942B12
MADALSLLCAELFAALPRKDQRRRGTEYVEGLLRTPGRKSIRNIGGRAGEQRLHHFVSDSTWDWAPVRRALRRHLLLAAPPQAWVLRSMIIPKAGAHSVGVARRFCTTRGASLNAQHAVGVWAATIGRAVPVGWRLHLDAPTDPRALGECLAEAYLEHADGDHALPVVVDARGADAAGLIGRLRAAGAPVLARVDPGTALWSATPLPGYGHGPLPAARLIRIDPHRRRRAVRLDGHDLTLLDEGWLTDVAGRTPDPAALLDRVDADLETLGERAGLRDFTGRSFAGWHRHITLASAAHALLALNGVTYRADAA